MPAEEADIHGIERHPVSQTQQSHTHTNKHCPSSSADSGEGGHSAPNNDPSTEQQSPPSNEKETHCTTSSVNCGDSSLTDSVDRIDDVTVVDNTTDSNNTTLVPDSVPDSA